MIEIIQADGTREQAVIAAMRQRAAEQNSEIERAVRAVMEDVRARGLEAVRECSLRFDGREPYEITREQRRALLLKFKHFVVKISAPCPVEEAIVTSGGIRVNEVNPTTMESKLVKGLYFAGELLDVDAYTGGFNLQIAWATGRAAGMAAAEEGRKS